jgi:hypothetical protein
VVIGVVASRSHALAATAREYQPILDPAFNRCLERSSASAIFIGSLALGNGFRNIAAGDDIASVPRSGVSLMA